MKRYFCFISFLLLFFALNAQIAVSELKVEGLVNPIGIDIKKPSFSWILNSSGRNISQNRYEICVYDNAAFKGEPMWKSGKIESANSIAVSYEGKPLDSSTRYYWKVRVWDNKGKASSWSPVAYWQTALLTKEEWKAKWIELSMNKREETRSPFFRKEFAADKEVKSAVLYVTSHGLYQAYLNGRKVGDAFLTPGWTSYKTRLQYQTYDVTSQIKPGENVLGAVLGNGWYKGTINWEPRTNVYGDKLGLLCQLEIRYKDGTKELVVSDEQWKSAFGEIQYAEIYNGETIDANKRLDGWNSTGYKDVDWQLVKVADYTYDNLIATYNQPIKKHEIFKTEQVITTPKGEKVLDFGQNLVGWEKVCVKGKKGDTIRIYHAEMLDKEGNFYTANLRSAKATSTYVLSGNEDVFEPHFTFYGFRYIKIEGEVQINPRQIEAITLYSDMPLNGEFTSSNSLINQLQKNIQWGQKGNFLDIPTDCPQRNERLGWTGDAQAFFRTAVFNRDGRNFFKKWLKDLSADQYKDGRVPWVIPHTLKKEQVASTGWGDVATIIPWQLYMAYGDLNVLKEQYQSMKGWVDFMRNSSRNNLWNTQREHFGDWLFYRPDDDKDGIAAITDKQLIAQCFYAHSTQLLINAAQALDKKEDVLFYTDLLQKIKDAFRQEYMTNNGRLVSDTQTAYVLALYFDMFPEDQRRQAVERLVENIKRYNNHITTGFLGTPYICHVLSRFGQSDVAYKLLLQETYPSWLYPVKAGATTIWERWDGRKPDGTFQTDEMNSFNHYAYGAIGDWLYRVTGGLQEAAPGYKEILIKPHLGGGLTSASVKQNTPYGKVASVWSITDRKLLLEVVIPVNTTAIISIPTTNGEAVKEGNKPLSAVSSIQIVGEEDGFLMVKVGSGSYSFNSLI